MKPQNKKAKPRKDEKPEPVEVETKPNPATPTAEQIQKRAYEIFVARGGEPGRELDDWLLAEYELKAEIGRRTQKPTE